MADLKNLAIQTVFNHLTTASKTASGLLKSAVGAQMQEAVIEINNQIIAAQNSSISVKQEHAAMLDEVRELKARIAELKDNSAELARYHLEEMDSGVRVYVLDEEEAVGCTPHEACPNCFGDGKIRILQPTHETVFWSGSGDIRYRKNVCVSCNSSFAYGRSENRRAPVRRSGSGGPDGWMGV